MLNQKLNDALNKQVNEELYSAYIYLDMLNYFAEKNLQGFVNWFNCQVQEEVAHAKGLMDYIQTRGGKVVLETVKKPDLAYSSIIDIFEKVLAHEQYITSKISELADVADETKDRAAGLFLQWYVKEQVEEEESATGVLETVKLIKDDANALLLYDKELAARVFNPPVIK